MIFYRNLRDDLIRIDRLYCADCRSPLRVALQKAALQNNSRFLICANCGESWIPDPDIEAAAAAWVLLFTTDAAVPAGVVCLDCATAHPEPATMPTIARMLLRQSNEGPTQ